MAFDDADASPGRPEQSDSGHAEPGRPTQDGPGEPVVVRSVQVDVVRPIRLEVLRPGQPPESAVLPGDDHPLSCHVAAYQDGTVVSVGTVFPDPPPWEPDRAGAWRVRGMATRDGMRGRRVGQLVLGALIDHAVAHGGRFIWCNARVGAVPFYGRSGFVVEGPPFDLAEGGEHRAMWRDL